MASRQSRILQLLNHRLKVTIEDGRQFIGTMLAFDKHMNLVLSETQEERQTPTGKEKRTVGLVIMRGDIIVSLSVEQGPRVVEVKKIIVPVGSARGIGRGLTSSLQGPAMGVGPGFSMPPGFRS